MSTPPSSWTGSGSSPMSSQAKSTANITSVSPTNEAIFEPSRRVPAMPVAYAVAVATSDSAASGTSQCTSRPASTTGPPVGAHRHEPGHAPAAPRASAATTIAPAAMTSGGSPVRWCAERTK